MFLDEIGDIDPRVQVKLLKLLEDKTVRRLGSVREQRADVRIVTATNRALEQAVRDGHFRADLLFRLRIVHFDLPPLRARGNDVLVLAEHYLGLQRARYRKPQLRFTAEAERAMLRYTWPGNVRELRNVIEQAVIMATGETIDAVDLRLTSTLALPSGGDVAADGTADTEEGGDDARAQFGGGRARPARAGARADSGQRHAGGAAAGGDARYAALSHREVQPRASAVAATRS